MADPREEVYIDYTNWRRERAYRRIRPGRVVFENNEWHPQTQWLLEAVDLDKGEERTFALANIHGWFSAEEVRIARELWKEKQSASFLQRRMQIGYGHAADLTVLLERTPT